jgi:hypothetical protein
MFGDSFDKLRIQIKQKRGYRINCNPLNLLVGETGIEPATPCSQGRCATRLRYSPTKEQLYSMVDAVSQDNNYLPVISRSIEVCHPFTRVS